jgi:hypothetical protein
MPVLNCKQKRVGNGNRLSIKTSSPARMNTSGLTWPDAGAGNGECLNLDGDEVGRENFGSGILGRTGSGQNLGR